MQVKNSIKLKNAYLVYNYKKNSPFIGLKNFNFEFEQNKIYCIIGESGSGKSSLISVFNGLNRLTYGDIEVCGVEIKSQKNINNCLLNYYPINNIEFISNFFNYDEHKKYLIMQCAYDANYYDIETLCLFLNNNIKPNFKKLTSRHLFNINFKLDKCKYYIVELETIDKLNKKLELKIENQKQYDTKTRIKINKKTKKIKDYKLLRKEVGMVSQFPEFQLFKSCVIDDVAFGPKIMGMKKKDAIESAKKHLNKLRIYDTHYYNSPFALSGGQKRRVAIAGILAIEGSILIFDEPTAGLDPAGEKEMINIIKEAKTNNKTVFVVTHSMEQVLEIADEVLVMHNGELIEHGDPYKIFNNKNIIKNTNIEVPYVINVINKLSSKKNIYNKLNELKPRTIEELAIYISKLKKGVS